MILTTNPKPGRKFAVSFQTENSWRNLGFFGKTIWFKNASVAAAVRWITNADFVSHYTV